MTVLAATDWTSNAELIEAVHQLGFIKDDDLVYDATYEKGIWWKVFRPSRLIAANLGEAGSAVADVHADFRHAPFADSTFDVVAYDPPYVCASLDTTILTKRGWLSYAEVAEGDQAYTLNHQTGAGEWQAIERVVVTRAQGTIEWASKSHSSRTTADHRWPVVSRSARRVWKTTSTVSADDVVPVSARRLGPAVQKYSDAFVELVAWFWTEGHVEDGVLGAVGDGGYGHIKQSRRVNPRNVARIRAALTECFGPPMDRFPRLGRVTDGAPRWREAVDGDNAVFWFSADLGRELLACAPNLIPSLVWIDELTSAQLTLFVDTALDGDGHRYGGGKAVFGQKVKESAEAFLFAAILDGRSATLVSGVDHRVHLRSRHVFKPSRCTKIDHVGEQVVWCVTVPNGSWFARRNGRTYFTGNCIGGRKTSTIPQFHQRYGTFTTPKTPAKLQALIDRGLIEMLRIVKPGGIVLVKCQDYISSGKLWIGTHHTLTWALDIGFTLEDRLEHISGTRAQPKNRTRKCDPCKGTGVLAVVGDDELPCLDCEGSGRLASEQQHARRNLSTLFVLRAPRRKS